MNYSLPRLFKNRGIIDLLKIFFFPIIILIIDAFLDYYNIYQQITWIDIPMHFIGGITIGLSFSMLLIFLQKKGYIGHMHEFVFFIFVISLVSLTALTWEFNEFALDLIDLKTRQTTIEDTMADLFLGLLGSCLGYLYSKSREHRPLW
mgnify:CR=1 FL=1